MFFFSVEMMLSVYDRLRLFFIYRMVLVEVFVGVGSVIEGILGFLK